MGEAKTNLCETINWFAVYTKPRAEKKVADRIQKLGYTVFLPLIPTIRIWSDRKKKIWIPLLPGFVFVHASAKTIYQALQAEGAVHVVKYLQKPAIIKDYEIQNLKLLVASPDAIIEGEPFNLEKGEEIIVQKGPFIGLQGKYIRQQSKHRVIVEIQAIGKMIEVNIPRSFLEKKAMKS